MENTKNKKLAIAIVAILLISSILAIQNFMTNSTVQAQLSSNDLLADDMYGYPIGPGYDSGNTFFNPGPAPNRPDILWTARRPDTGGSLSGAPLVAFDGKLFAYGGNQLWAFDPMTGSLIASSPMNHGNPRGFGTATFFKVADGYIGYETSQWIVVHRTDTCEEVGAYNRDSTYYGNHGGGSVVYWGGFYSSYDMKKYTTALSNVANYTASPTPVHLAIAYDLSDPLNPTLAWMWPAPTGIEALGSAPGLAIFGGYGEGEIYALNATTGELVWRQRKDGNAGYIANYADGKIYHSASSTSLTCYNATTGEIIFSHLEGPRAYFVFGDAIAYGRYLGKNIALPNSIVGAWSAETGEPLWQTTALYSIAYLTPVVADGKMFVMRYSGTAGGEIAETSTFACYDVFTGAILWELTNFRENGFSAATPIVAYGNLYVLVSGTIYCIGDKKDPFPTFHGGTVDAPGVQYGRTAPLDISFPTWTYDAGASIGGSAVAGNGKVYFGTYGAEVHCVNAYTGENIWTFPLGYRMASTPALVGNRLYIGPDDGNIYCIDAETGEQIWKRPAGGQTQGFWIPAWQIRASPVIVGNRLYVGALDGKFYCLNTENGNLVWTANFDRGAERPNSATALVLESMDMVIASCTDSYLYAFSMDDGDLLWKQQVQPTSGFDDRAMTSTPVYDRGALWMVCDTWMLARFNATTGEFMGQYRLPYSARTGTMTPAITTPAIYTWDNNRISLYVGDGFQFVAFDITTISLDPMLFVNVTVIGTRTPTAFFRGPPIRTVNSTTANNVADNVGNETYLPIIGERWLGHQVYSSAVVSATLQGVRIYFGDDVNSITVINATGNTFNFTNALGEPVWGAPLSVYNTKGPVFASACIYDGWLFMGSQDGIMYAFATLCEQDFEISAAASKSGQMWSNETLLIRGRLLPTVRIDEETGFGTYPTNGYPNATVKLSVTLPDLTDASQEATTDNDGWFEFSYSPTAAGEYGWVVYYDGEVKPWITYLEAYTEWTPISVTAPPTGETNPPPPPPPTDGIPIEYIYAAIVVIIIVVIAIGAYAYTKKRKK